MDQDSKRVGRGSQGGHRGQERYSQIAGQWVRLAWKERPSPRTELSPHVIGTVARELRARRRRRVVAKWVGGGLGSVTAATGAIVLALFLTRHPQVSTGASAVVPDQVALADHSASVSNSRVLRVWEGTVDGVKPPSQQRIVAAGDDFRAPAAGPIRIVGDEGSELVIEPGGGVHVVEADAIRKFQLLRGAVRAHVKKLLVGERFIIGTADAVVEVHGTQFRVSLEDSGGTCAAGGTVTGVSVSEGVVTVAWPGHEERLLPGDRWMSRCPLAVASDRKTSSGAQQNRKGTRSRRKLSHADPVLAVGESRPSASVGRKDPDSGAASPATSNLAAQNDLFSAAVRAKRNGQLLDSQRRFERLVREYPTSSLVEGALVNRMRLLTTTDRQKAVTAAADYLSRFPDGFARGEAQTILIAPSKR